MRTVPFHLTHKCQVLQPISTSNRSTIVKTKLSSEQNPPSPHKTQKQINLLLIVWRFNLYRQALHPTDPKLSKTLCVAWRLGVCRQAVPLPGTQNTYNGMYRLAVIHHPPGSFWKNSRNAEKSRITMYKRFNLPQFTC